MKLAKTSIDQAKIVYQAPSNIAFIKYWGKRDRQIPLNASLSMTLKKCYTQTSVEFIKLKHDSKQSIEFYFEMNKNDQFAKRITTYLRSIEDLIPWIKQYKLIIHSHNSFPHSTGIASSASSFASLACCLEHFFSLIEQRDFSIDKASSMARIGSGSAARSFQGPFMVWGKHPSIKKSDDHYAVVFEDHHPNLSHLCNSVLIVDSQSKKISSSQGHMLMNTHLFKEVRIQQAQDNLKDLAKAMQEGDFPTFGKILEQEALSLHAMMMTSYPSFTLLRPKSLSIIEAVKAFRDKTSVQVYFTIDAGPNIHLIYPDKDKKTVQLFIQNELSQYCENEKVIHDEVGQGITEVKVEAK